jgi:single-strand DNA-binding protein
LNHQQITIAGRVGRDPEIRYTQAGEPVTSWSMAVSETWNGRTGKQERTTWFNITAFGKTAQIARDYVKKGSLLLVVGRIQTDEWTDKDGNQKKSWKVIVDRLVLGPKPAGERSSSPASSAPAAAEQGEFQATDDDVPF